MNIDPLVAFILGELTMLAAVGLAFACWLLHRPRRTRHETTT